MTLYSRANLEVVRVASAEGYDRALNGVRFEKDGSTVAGTGKVLLAVGPVDSSKVSFPEKAGKDMTPGDRGLVMTTDAIQKALKHMPRDKRTMLQHVKMVRTEDAARVGFCSIDVGGDLTTTASLPKNEVYPNWKDVVRKIKGTGQGVQVCVNRKDLIEMLQGLEAACPDKGGVNPVFLEVSPDGLGIVARCTNYETGQHAVGAINAYNTKGQWLQKDQWERGVFATPVKMLKSVTNL